ncbi:hypothetical protein [Paraliobacillus sediminis]|uniref:hypothetical protein n=1 Tax=Paraliobacillus sediminis TaxID=1885916 RepID=UPI000E3D9D95|nr:hypothetical protein [Paraliobacillus sediminis]
MRKIMGLSMSLLIISLFFLSACAPSEDEALELTETAAKTVFEDNTTEPNNTLDSFSLYLPSGYEIIEESQSNLLLESGDQTFILFYNALEDTTSELNYQAAEANGNNLLLQSFEDEGRFAFVKVSESGDEYELQVGVGGVKITTQTSIRQLEDYTIEMMQIATSLAYTDQD